MGEIGESVEEEFEDFYYDFDMEMDSELEEAMEDLFEDDFEGVEIERIGDILNGIADVKEDIVDVVEDIMDIEDIEDIAYVIEDLAYVREDIANVREAIADTIDSEMEMNNLFADDYSENIDNSDYGGKDKEINEKQKAEIKEAFEKIKNGEKLTNEELGNLGEMMMDQYYISKGYKPLNEHRVTSLDDKKDGFKTGIDGVYEKSNPDGTKLYVIADAKYNTSQLSETRDGKQMSDNWIDKRLDNAVGKEKADEIRDATEDDPDSVRHEVYHINPTVDENGNIHTDIHKVDQEGNKVGDRIIVEYFDEDGNRIVK